MHCEIVVPGLFSASRELRLPAAELAVARGRRSDEEGATLESWLAQQFGLDAGPLAAGVLTLLAHGGNSGGATWARADPVHLRLLRDRISLIPAEAFALSRDEADALRGALNEHFAGRLEFQAVEPRRWCVRLQGAMALEEQSALAAAGADLKPGRAGDALANEIQMVLHEHPVNEAREARGEPAVNGLWLWGAGAAAPAGLARWQSVTSDEPIALGLARGAGLRARELPASAAMLLERTPEDGRHLVVLDALRAPLALRDAEAFAVRARSLEEAWFAPLLAALRSGRIGMLSVHVPDTGRSVETIRGDLRRFWRRARPLSTMSP